MSGFLQRLLSRHAGEPVIRPRAASRFELAAAPLSSPEQAGVPAGPPLATQARHAAPAPRPQVRAATTEESRTEIAGHRSASRVAMHHNLERPRRDATPARALPEADPHRPAISDPGDAPVEPPSPLRARAIADLPDASHARPSLPNAEGVGPLTTIPRIRLPASNMPQSLSRRAEAAGVASREPDVVHVHIGRVEVRAVMAVQERSRPTGPSADAPRPLSLDRYLAGKRDK